MDGFQGSNGDTKRRATIVDFICDDLLPEQQVLSGVAHVDALNAMDESQLVGRVEDTDAIMLYHNISLTRQTIERLERCSIIVRCGVGYDNVDWKYAGERGIPVVNVPDYGTEEVADSAVGMTLTLVRGIHYLNSRLRAGNGPWFYTQVQPLHRLRDRVFGIVGLGRIGSATAVRAKALGMDVVFYDPYQPDGMDKALGIRRASTLKALLEQCFVLSLHCPHTPETRHIISERSLAWMPRGSYLVNTARGAVVDTDAIPHAIQTGQLAGAAIDVLVQEPPSDDTPLVAAWRDPNHPCHDRVILNPHSAFYCEEGLTEMRRKGAAACRAAIQGEPIRNLVNTVTEQPHVRA